MLAPGLANVVVVQHLVLGVFAYLLVHFGGLLEKHLFLGRTLLLRLQGYQTYVGAGMLTLFSDLLEVCLKCVCVCDV